MATLDELVKAITQLQSEVVSSKDLTNSLTERVSQLQNRVEKKEQSPTGVSWPGHFAKDCPIKTKSKRGPVQKVATNASVESENLKHPSCREGLLLGVTVDPSQSKHLKLGIRVQVKKKTYFKKALVDSGATGNFVDAQLVRAWGISCIEKKTPETIQAVDGKLLTGGPITLQTVPLTIICEGKNQRKKHKEELILDVIHAPQYGIILGLPWLTHHNPEINWAERKIVFSSVLCKEHCLQRTQESEVRHSYIATAAGKEVLLPKQYLSYEDVFDEKEAENLPPHRSYDCQIDLVPGGILPNCRVYALSEHENQHLRKYLDKFLENGFIRASKSPTASPLFFVSKANGELRTCIDYRGLNKITFKNKFPLPLILVLLEQVKKAKIYTKLDLRGVYHLVRMREGDEWKTAFKTRYGLFEYTVMPFGLCNAPAAFQFFLNDVLREYLDIFAIVYIDDILIYSDNENEHVQHVKKILAALRKHHLYCKLTKCESHVTTVEFLGVILTPQGMVMAERKVKAVSEWPIPKSVCDVQCFLGFANFYRRFINHFSQTVAPITKLLRKKETFVWSPEADQAFSTLKEAFSTAPVLTHPDADRPFIVEADASDVAIGAVLSQRNKDTGQLHPVAYMSRKLNEAEQNYVIAEKELLAIRDAFKEWRHHLLGAKYTVTVYTDHRNLQFMSSARLLTPRQLRWMLFFAEFDFLVTFWPGKDNRKADALSRQESTTLPAVQTSRAIIAPDKVLCIIKTEDFFEDIRNSFTVEKWQAWAQADPKRSIKQGLPFYDARLFVPTTKLRKIVFHWLHVIPTADLGRHVCFLDLLPEDVKVEAKKVLQEGERIAAEIIDSAIDISLTGFRQLAGAAVLRRQGWLKSTSFRPEVQSRVLDMPFDGESLFGKHVDDMLQAIKTDTDTAKSLGTLQYKKQPLRGARGRGVTPFEGLLLSRGLPSVQTPVSVFLHRTPTTVPPAATTLPVATGRGL
ncbi:hypothetical protein NDU88_004520 [Pleurodeles waltl]|uniref:ribonuclease H n=2 Tax=Pleurodeles waltl TaxID=8319 RepID=A0AAV7PCS4_PLEWA|nr:hypothetical protein NDU88_004520 [Pleurodeles waltl]